MMLPHASHVYTSAISSCASVGEHFVKSEEPDDVAQQRRRRTYERDATSLALAPAQCFR